MSGYVEVSSKQSLVEKYLEFKQLMLRIDPAEEDPVESRDWDSIFPFEWFNWRKLILQLRKHFRRWTWSECVHFQVNKSTTVCFRVSKFWRQLVRGTGLSTTPVASLCDGLVRRYNFSKVALLFSGPLMRLEGTLALRLIKHKRFVLRFPNLNSN